MLHGTPARLSHTFWRVLTAPLMVITVWLMSRQARHTIHAHQCHLGWDNAIAPVLTVAPGDEVACAVQDASGGQLTAQSDVGDVLSMAFEKINPVTGPIVVDGARPGDALKVSVLELSPSGWGWTASIPGFGLLADQFPQPALHIWNYDTTGRQPAAFGPGGRVPLKPFCGTMGVAPAQPGLHSIVPPRQVGGNMDIRDLAAGAELYLPVEVDGALFSVGDSHAAQGDGEVCGTAIESPMDVVLRFELVRDANLPFPRFTTPGPVTRHLDAKGYTVTTGIGPDLMAAARGAVSGMIDHLGASHAMAAIDAYMLCSVCGDLRISEIVDAPNWVVSFYFPHIIFD